MADPMRNARREADEAMAAERVNERKENTISITVIGKDTVETVNDGEAFAEAGRKDQPLQ